MDGKRCVGVRYQVRGEAREARVGREVIVSCGTINSPKLLELSGIGQPEILRQHGIDVVHALPGVGENLRDHYAVLLKYTITPKGRLAVGYQPWLEIHPGRPALYTLT